MRTENAFQKIFCELKFFVDLHNKSVWLVPSNEGYHLSVIKPNGSDLPYGTRSNLYDTSLDIVDFVDSTRVL